MRFQAIILGYFVIGATMWGGGVISWDEAGVGQLFVDSPNEGVEVNQETASSLEQIGGPIMQAANSVGGGGLVAILSIILKFLGYLFWPIVTLRSVSAPIEIVLLLGGSTTVVFFGSVLRLVRRSA